MVRTPITKHSAHNARTAVLCSYRKYYSAFLHIARYYNINCLNRTHYALCVQAKYSVILSVLVPRKCEYLKDYSLDFVHAYMTTYLAS